MSHDHEQPDVSVMFTAQFWDERYGTDGAIWSGRPNRRLVEQVGDLPPGSALDVGSGEGADVIWLAQRGWQVTGVDVSAVALDRSRQRARDAGDDVPGRITWRRADLLTWEPPQEFDLVSAQYMHLPGPVELASLHRRLAAAVRPGGTLLVVGHHPSDLVTLPERHGVPEMLFTAEQVASVLDLDEWRVRVCTSVPRVVPDAEGRAATIHDAVLRAVRRAPR